MIPIPADFATEEFLRPIFLTLHQQVTQRIFDQGLDARDAQIGEYSEEYIKRRVKKGLGASPKVILQFTGQMRNDFVFIQDQERQGSGFLNQANADKSKWVEETYNKVIFDLTEKEERLLSELIEAKIDGSTT